MRAASQVLPICDLGKKITVIGWLCRIFAICPSRSDGTDSSSELFPIPQSAEVWLIESAEVVSMNASMRSQMSLSYR